MRRWSSFPRSSTPPTSPPISTAPPREGVSRRWRTASRCSTGPTISRSWRWRRRSTTRSTHGARRGSSVGGTRRPGSASTPGGAGAEPASRGRGPAGGGPLAIAREPLRGEVRRRLLSGLLHGEPAPGTGIQEAALAAELGVSRTPLREALLSLEQEGFLRSEPGRGFFVPPLTIEDAREIYPVVASLEGLALRLAAPIEPDRVERLARLNDELKGAQSDPGRALDLDRAWHALLLERSRNRRLSTAIAGLKGQAYRYEYAYM